MLAAASVVFPRGPLVLEVIVAVIIVVDVDIVLVIVAVVIIFRAKPEIDLRRFLVKTLKETQGNVRNRLF